MQVFKIIFNHVFEELHEDHGNLDLAEKTNFIVVLVIVSIIFSDCFALKSFCH
jgi:hypothetical protein